ncbi:uncharacterized protein LOC105220176 isoform X2 [Zeugodacus cucurbitae]|uniref:uncharacterized protein LOC105220176 isoform X2 n=1 Tax=Zeugodacus cucurbitae TaxID=28588 RepID=UPI0023D913F4|nr:uncharacterized protein LOC105220176 isoform X2 [Zeugodacus cucurbitae]
MALGLKIFLLISISILIAFYGKLLCFAEVSYHTCKVRAGIGKNIEDFEMKRAARSAKAECFRICYALMTNTRYYTRTCLAGTTNYSRWFTIFHCPEQIRNPVLIADGIIPDEFTTKKPINLCPGWIQSYLNIRLE